MSEKYEELINNNFINLLWLILMIGSASLGIIALVIYILAVTNVQILSWSIGYILLSATNDVVLMPSIVVSIISVIVFVLCILKNRILKAIDK